MKALLIDAYDSFIYIIHQYLLEMKVETTVVRNDAITADAIANDMPDFLILGPGPGHPSAAGYVDIIRSLEGRLPMLGVCLGHQAIGLAYGGVVRRGKAPVHGKASAIRHQGQGVFTGLPDGFMATRYHSLVVEEPLPDCLEMTARSDDDGHIMGLRHRTAPIEGVQFHPESVGTQNGRAMFARFVSTHVTG